MKHDPDSGSFKIEGTFHAYEFVLVVLRCNDFLACSVSLCVLFQLVSLQVDSTNNFPLECVIRRVFRSSQGSECMLLCPVDT